MPSGRERDDRPEWEIQCVPSSQLWHSSGGMPQSAHAWLLHLTVRHPSVVAKQRLL